MVKKQRWICESCGKVFLICENSDLEELAGHTLEHMRKRENSQIEKEVSEIIFGKGLVCQN